MAPLVAAVLGFIPDLIKGGFDYVKGKSEQRAKKQESQQRIEEAMTASLIKRLETNDAADNSLDYLLISQRSWRSTYLLIVVTMPLLVLLLAPSVDALVLLLSTPEGATTAQGDPLLPGAVMTQAVKDGLKALEATPIWYQIALLICFVDVFGMRRILSQFIPAIVAFVSGKLARK